MNRGLILKHLREKRRMSEGKLALKSGVNISTISRLENNKYKMTSSHQVTFNKIAKALNMSYSQFMEALHLTKSNHYDIYDEIKNGDAIYWQGKPVDKKKLLKWFKEGFWA